MDRPTGADRGTRLAVGGGRAWVIMAWLLVLWVTDAGALEHDWWVAADGVTLREAAWSVEGEPTGTLLLLPGHQEFAEKYAELANWAVSGHWEARLLEWRGQGLSDRVLNDVQMAHHADFAVPARDLADWLAQRGEPFARPLIVVAHSLGAHLALRALVDQPRTPIDGLVLSAPMLMPSTRPFPSAVARRIAALAVRLGLGERYALGQGPYSRDSHRFDGNPVTTDRRRWAVHHDYFQDRPELVLGGVTWGWLDAAQRSWRIIDARAPDAVRVPVLILSAPDDRMVVSRLHSGFCSRLEDCELVEFPGARHELFMEADGHRQRVLEHVQRFLDHRFPAGQQAR